MVIRLAPAERMSCVSRAATTRPMIIPMDVSTICWVGIASHRRSMAAISFMVRPMMALEKAKHTAAPTRAQSRIQRDRRIGGFDRIPAGKQR